ncbi:MAG: hypothetical protein KY444_07885, partial [Gemmatimonadetes bacterium]|nr:hypothetical protein [Gemmatimonadota bacterium]
MAALVYIIERTPLRQCAATSGQADPHVTFTPKTRLAGMLLAGALLLGGCEPLFEPEEWGNVPLLWRTPYEHDYWFDGTPAIEGDRVFGGI